jgi:diacylglycerol kinase
MMSSGVRRVPFAPRGAPDPMDRPPASPPNVHGAPSAPPRDEFDDAPPLMARAGRRNSREKMAAGLSGLKHAIRGDSSFFAHGYRGLLICLTAAMLGVNPFGWCLIVLGACLVLLSELTHSAVDTLARAVGDPQEPLLKTARDIAAAGVLVAAFSSGAVTVVVLTLKFGELLGGWIRIPGV